MALNSSEIKEIIFCLHETFEFIENLRSTHPLAIHVHKPPIPQQMSESIVINAIDSGSITALNMCEKPKGGGKKADILAYHMTTGNEIKIEVKATGPGEFITMGSKDYNCDYLVWILFKDKIIKSGVVTSVEILIFNDLVKISNKTSRKNLKPFIAEWLKDTGHSSVIRETINI